MVVLKTSRFPNCFDHLNAFNSPWDLDPDFPEPNDEEGVWFLKWQDVSFLIALLEEDDLQNDWPAELNYLRSFV